MGLDIDVKILHGFKIPLSVCFSLNILNDEILLSDDWQELDNPESRDPWVLSSVFQKILKDNNWNLYILTSSQEDSDPEKSYLFLYEKSQELYSGRITDYETGVIQPVTENEEILKLLNEIPLPKLYSWKYNIHWIVEGSW